MRPIRPPVQAALWLMGQQALKAVGGRRRPSPAAVTGGTLCLVGAGVLGFDALRRFLQVGTTWQPHDPQHATHLVTDGPNAITRNPMYTALALGLVGTGLLSGRPWTSVAAAGLVATLAQQIEHEEAALAEVFGAEYTAYRARVPRWLGPF